MIQRIKRVSMSVPIGMTLLMSVLWACGDDDETTSSATDAGADVIVATPDSSSDAPVVPANTLPSYIVPGTEGMAAITLDRNTGDFYVDSAESGKIYSGKAGANTESTLALFADLTSAGIAHGGHITLGADGKTLYMLSALGDAPRASVIDIATKQLVKTLPIASSSDASAFAFLQDIAVSADQKTLFATDSLENVIHTLDIESGSSSSFAISSEFPHIAQASQGFINATGLAASADGKYLLVVHLIDKHIYRISLDPTTLGQAKKIDTDPYNISGNGLWLDPNGDVLEVAGDELRIFRFSMNAEYEKGTFAAKYQDDAFEQGLTYAVAYQKRILVLNGSGTSLSSGPPGGGGGGFPEAGPPEGGGFPPTGSTDAGSKKLPIKVLQISQ